MAALTDAGRKPGPIVEPACWAYARRQFFDFARLDKAPIAVAAPIDTLLEIERESNGLTPQERLRMCSERSRPREQCARVSGHSKIGQAIAYSLTRWVALTRVRDDG
jgi:transposase